MLVHHAIQRPKARHIVSLLLAALIIGGSFSWRSLHRTEQYMHSVLLRNARIAAGAIPLETVTALSGSSADLSSPHYQRLKSHLIQARRLYPECRFLYLMGQRPDGAIFFYADSEAPGSDDESLPGDIYEEVDEDDHRAFATGIPESYPPFTDHWGTWVSASVPLIDPRTDTVLAIFGMDVDAAAWQRLKIRSMAFPAGCTAMLLGIILGSAALIRVRSRRESLEQRYGWLLRHAAAAGVAAAGLALTGLITHEVADWEFQNRMETFARLAAAKSFNVTEAMRDIRNIQLESLGRFFDSSDHVDREEFRLFTEYLSRDPAVQAWGWIPIVPTADRARIEHEAIASGIQGYAFWEHDEQKHRIPAASRAYYHPVLYLEPMAGNEYAYGYDLGTEPIRLKAIEEATRTGLVTATETVILVQDKRSEPGILVLRPVFGDDTLESQKGFVVAALWMQNLLRHSVRPLDAQTHHIALSLYQLRDSEAPAFLASTNPSGAGAQDSGFHSVVNNNALALVVPLFLYGKAYTLVAHPGPAFNEMHPIRAAYIAAPFGLALAFILTVLTMVLTRRRETLETAIRERTEALWESQSMLQLVLDSIPMRVFWKDRNSTYMGCNMAFAKDAGFHAPEEIIGKDDYAIGWKQQAEQYRADDREVMTSGRSKLHYEEPQTTPDGRRIWLRTSKVPLRNAKDEVAGILGVYEDITEQKQAEESLRKLSAAVEQSPAIVVITDMDGVIEYVNPKFTAVTGYSLDDVLGKTPSILKSGETPLETYKELWAAIKSGKEWQGEFHNKRKDGSRFWESAVISPIRDAAGNTTHFIGVKEDITQQKSLEDQLRQAQKMESVGRLAGGVAHDFNNMLQAILGYADLTVGMLQPGHPAREFIEEIQKAAQRSAALTRQLLAFSRKQTIQPVILDMNETITGMLKMLQRIIGEDIRLVWKPGHNLWPVKMDPAQVDQIMVNLAANARDAIPGVGKLTVETANVTIDQSYCDNHAEFVPGSYVLLAVSDDGCGMDKQTLAMLFEPFFTTKNFGEGTGLGLATVYGIVKQNGGFINVYSELGRGTCFKIYLRRTEDEGDAADTAGEPPMLTGTETVLLVEDEHSILTLGKTILKQIGYRVLTARTPGEALTVATQHKEPIHLLITDVVMPEMNGKQLKERLLTFMPHLKTLYMSGYTANVIAHHGIIEEDIHFLQKPFSATTLAQKVREVLAL